MAKTTEKSKDSPAEKKTTPSEEIVNQNKRELELINKRLGDYEFKINITEKDRIQAVLSKHNINKDNFIASCVNIFRKTPKLLLCEFSEIFFALISCAEVGLEPNTIKQHAFVVPFKNNSTGKYEAKVIFGYMGVREIMFRNPDVTKIRAELIFQNDIFEERIENNVQEISHVRAKENRGRRIGVYCQVFYKYADPETKVMYLDQIMAIKGKSKNPQNYEESHDPEGWYWKKACIKQLGKTMSDSHDLGKVIHIDNAMEGGNGYLQIRDNKLLLIEEGKPIKGLRTSIFGDAKTQAEKISEIANIPNPQINETPDEKKEAK